MNNRPDKDKWLFLAFRPSYVPLDEIVGGAQVRPYELFNAYAAAGHHVHIWETDGLHQETRRYHDGRLVVRPLKNTFGITSFISQYFEMRSIIKREVAEARDNGFEKLCYYNQVPVSVVFRFGFIPMLTQPGILHFDYARSQGMMTWGNVHDISPDHELGARERVHKDIPMKNIEFQARLHEKIQKTYLAKSDFISTGGVGMKEAIIERYGHSADKITVMLAGYNEELLSQVTPWTPPKADQPWTIGYLGSYMDASLGILIDALHLLGRSDINLILAGKGMEKAVQSHANPWPNTEVVNDATYSSFATVANKVDIWSVPLSDTFAINYMWQLKMPMYFASGRPIVRTKGKALDDTNLSEYVFQSDQTPQALASALKEAIDNPEEASSRAKRGQEVMKEKFTWTVVAEDMLRELRRLHSEKAT